MCCFWPVAEVYSVLMTSATELVTHSADTLDNSSICMSRGQDFWQISVINCSTCSVASGFEKIKIKNKKNQPVINVP